MRRDHDIKEYQKLRNEPYNMGWREIGERLGISWNGIRDWVNRNYDEKTTIRYTKKRKKKNE